MPSGELLKHEFLKEKLEGVLNAAYQAGVEVVRDGRVSEETEAQIQKAVISADEIAEMGNLWWDSHLEGIAQRKPEEAGRAEDIRLLLRGMAVTFNAQAGGDLKATIQFKVAGKQPGNWFLSIEGGKCTFHEGKVDSPTLTIKTPSEIWLAIANGALDGRQAFMEGKYTFDMSVAALPMKEKRGCIIAGTNVVIFADSSREKQEAAWEFVKWFTSPEITARWAVATGYVPVRKSSLRSEAMQKRFDEVDGLRDALDPRLRD